MKKCTICWEVKPYQEFHKQSDRKDGYGNWCKPCKSIKKAAQYEADKDRIKARVAKYRELNSEKASEAKKKSYLKKPEHYKAKRRDNYIQNREKISEYNRKYRIENTDKKAAQDKLYKESNRSRINARQIEYQKENSERILKYQKQYRKNRFRSDVIYALIQLARSRISIAFRKQGYKKNTKTHDMIGCAFEELVTHLESQFADGMTWENRGKWHIDHIIPLASAKTEQELIKLCHYTNLQPLWAFENLRKGAKTI